MATIEEIRKEVMRQRRRVSFGELSRKYGQHPWNIGYTIKRALRAGDELLSQYYKLDEVQAERFKPTIKFRGKMLNEVEHDFVQQVLDSQPVTRAALMGLTGMCHSSVNKYIKRLRKIKLLTPSGTVQLFALKTKIGK